MTTLCASEPPSPMQSSVKAMPIFHQGQADAEIPINNFIFNKIYRQRLDNLSSLTMRFSAT